MKKILAVDDDPCMRDLLRLHLSSAGYEVTTAEDAVEALKVVLRQPPDALIVDINMPYMNGLEFVATLKQDAHTRPIPVLFLTARHDADEAVRKCGAIACLKKPLYVTDLLVAVAALVEERSFGRIAA